MTGGVLFLFVLFVTIAVYEAVSAMIHAYVKFRGDRLVTCPQNRQPAVVRVDARHAAVAAAVDLTRLRLTACSRWPEMQDCGQNCLRQVVAHPDDCLVREIVSQWYTDKRCVFCAKPFGPVRWLDHPPALSTPDHKTLEWDEVPPETLPRVFETHQPVCWDCHVTETFRRVHPELVVDRPRH